ncbi:MAG: FliA/WhiG family RNA polymerase sigma factor [Lachnospiraceae bacterium]|uniref:RNA polymerase sigma factor n=1 Tax=Candidatus Weimeria bifida TaxID=2599074 RepID=A0A6N7IYG5_9FIRM|nr:FliA/WhiG family RNA polymerase sigma factor [Candidatus Weimeria bifida]RRF96309.1 MAG: FliA/WhiG family RNA polymerase sigma factor [Lachnospiraceae bacterium]
MAVNFDSSLWDQYAANPTPALREKLIIEYSPLVKIVAGKMSMYLGKTVEYEDLVSYGIFGLIDAIDKFDIHKDVKFETYASLRIKGSILDQIRKMDWIPRTIRQKQRQLDTAAREIEERTGHEATDEELAEELGMDEEEYYSFVSSLKVTNLVSLNEFMDAGGNEPAMDTKKNSYFEQPEEKVSREELSRKLKDALDLLTEKEKKVIVLYYYEDLTLKEISEVMSVSESRVSQLHTKALKKMRKVMGSYMEFF